MPNYSGNKIRLIFKDENELNRLQIQAVKRRIYRSNYAKEYKKKKYLNNIPLKKIDDSCTKGLKVDLNV